MNMPELDRYFDQIEDAFDRIGRGTGVDLVSTDPIVSTNPPPLGVTIVVTGVDGKYQVKLTNPQPGVNMDAGAFNVAAPGDFYGSDPRQGRDLQSSYYGANGQLKPILHELQSSTTLNFDAAGSVTTYGPAETLAYEIQDPNQTKYWRVRSRFSDSDFGPYVYYSSAAVCGPIGVLSGYARSWGIAPNSVKATNNASVSWADFDVASGIVSVSGPGGAGTDWHRLANDHTGNVVEVGPYPATDFTGLAYAQTYYVAYNPVANAFICSTDFSETLPDGYFWVGSATANAAFGGAGGSDGGGGEGSGGRGGDGYGWVF